MPVAGHDRGGFSFTKKQVSPGFGRIGRADNLLNAFAAAPGQGALDGEGENSPFDASLVRHLGTEGLEIRTALALVQQDVYDRTRGVQLPYVESGPPELVFTAGTAALPERKQLLLAMSGVRAEDRIAVERVAGEVDMPLAPLFGALFTASLEEASSGDRDRQLRQAAEAFARVRDNLRTLSFDDPQVTALRQEAERQLSLGAFDAARAALTQAAEIDNSSRQTLRDNYRARTLSETETHYLNAEAALADLRRDLAIADYGRAVDLFKEVLALDGGKEVQWRHYASLLNLGDAQIIKGDLTSAKTSFERMPFLLDEMAKRHPDKPGWRRNQSVSQS